jgi:hypothetical protein
LWIGFSNPCRVDELAGRLLRGALHWAGRFNPVGIEAFPCTQPCYYPHLAALSRSVFDDSDFWLPSANPAGLGKTTFKIFYMWANFAHPVVHDLKDGEYSWHKFGFRDEFAKQAKVRLTRACPKRAEFLKIQGFRVVHGC